MGKSKMTEVEVKVTVQIPEAKALFLRQHVAEAKVGGEDVEVSMINMVAPAIRFRGRFFIFTLEALTRAVVEQAAGLAGVEKGGGK